MQILLTPLENHILGEKTSFSAEEAVAQTILSVKNADGFSANDYIVLGKIGSETAEMRLISDISSDLTTITVSVATKFIHYEDDEITLIRYNQRKFYRSTSESGTYTHLSAEDSPVDIQVDKPEGTEFEDSSGVSTSWYKATYFNSTTSNESLLSDCVATKAGDTEHYTSIYKIKKEAGFENNSYIGSDTVSDFRNESENQAESAVATVYSLPFSAKPKIFQQIVTLLSAGLLLSQEYGMEADVEISKTGQRKIDRAESLLDRIVDGKITLRDDNGNELAKISAIKASSSNIYDSDKSDRGEMFNLKDERFRMTDPEEELSSSAR